MKAIHPFEQFLASFIPQFASKSKQLNQAAWILETTGSADASDLKAALDIELKLLFNDRDTYQHLVEWDQDPSLSDPLLKRQLNVLLRAFKQNMPAPELLSEIAGKEAKLSLAYANFRPDMDGKKITENEIRDILKKENDPAIRKKAWEASKQIGHVLAPQILSLVHTRNTAARSLGYTDFFHMQLDLQEVDSQWLFSTFETLAIASEEVYSNVVKQIEKKQAERFHVEATELGPWAWGEPFCQEDPLDTLELDALVSGLDICEVSVLFYQKMGLDVRPVLDRSDMFERNGKNQHAFCMSIDRESDVRTLNNVKPTLKWLETILHEFGHAVYELGYDHTLPWLLKEPPHMITTEAMALLAGRQAYQADSLLSLIKSQDKDLLIHKAEESLMRRQLIFSRWVLVMTHFEKELYMNPEQDLNLLWWQLVNQYQKIHIPPGRNGQCDWAAKYHTGLAPVYYFSYLLGELFASEIQEALLKITDSKSIACLPAGTFLQNSLFHPGNRMNWPALIQQVVGKPLSPQSWLYQFSK